VKNDLDAWLIDLISQQECRGEGIPAESLARSWDNYFDARAEEQRGDMIVRPPKAELNALHLLAGLLDDDDQAIEEVLTDLDGDGTVAVVKVLLQILIRQVELDSGIDHPGNPEVDGLAVGEPDMAGLGQLDSDGLFDVLVKVCTMLLGAVGADRYETFRGNIRAQLSRADR
jgi:hypothetical protein